MDASSTMVIKVKYGDMLRRFNAQIVGDELNLRMDGLREKIHNLFSLNPDTELMLTYLDEDNDVVALVDDNDLRDVVKQGLDPLRITVKVNAEKNGRDDNHSSESSTPLRSPQLQQPLQNLNTGLSEILKTVPEPLRESLLKLSADLTSKASSSAPGMTELVDHLSKVGLSYLGQLSASQRGVQSSMHGCFPTETKDSELVNINPDAAPEVISKGRPEPSSNNNDNMEKLKPEATMKKTELKSQNVAGVNVAGSSSGSIGSAELPSIKNLAPVPPPSGVHSIGKKEKLKKVINLNGKYYLANDLPPHANDAGKLAGSSVTSSNLPSDANKIAIGKESSIPSEAKPGSNPATAGSSDPRKVEYVSWNHAIGSSNFPGSFSGLTPAYECPFSGTALGNIPASLPPFRSITQDGSGNVFHRGVRCDGCGVHPITGPRFKSKVKVDYDLCSICFQEMGNTGDYIRMDRPALYRHHMSLKGLHDARAKDWSTSSPQVCRGFKVKPALKLDSRFIQDVNVFDGTVIAPLSPFTKIWRMRNNGTAVWPQRTQLVWIGGDKLSNEISVEVQIPADGLMIDQELDIAVDFISPELPGRYISYWRMASPSGQKFGQRVWVLIQVDASVEEKRFGSVRNLNLNLPPVNSSGTGPEIINVNQEPIIEDNSPEAHNSKKIVEVVQTNTEQELKFPINDTLLVGNGAASAPNPLPPASSSEPISYPIIDLSDVAQPLPQPSVPFAFHAHGPVTPSASEAPIASAQQSTVDLPEEERLLKELEEMGFKQVDLNKEVLRMNEYDLEQAVDELCGVAEWDPILEELQEMGFKDTETNKLLLKKNNGSIKRVVMDLIAGEEI